MRVVAASLSFEDFLEKISKSPPLVDLVLLTQNFSNTVSYEKEIAGKTSVIKKLVDVSKKLDCTVFAALELDLFSDRRTSVLVAENGKLLGIVDKAQPTVSFKDIELKLYKTKVYDIGVLVGMDILQEKFVKLQKKFGAHLIVNLGASLIKKEDLLRHKDCKVPILSYFKDECLFLGLEQEEIQAEVGDFIVKEFKI